VVGIGNKNATGKVLVFTEGVGGAQKRVGKPVLKGHEKRGLEKRGTGHKSATRDRGIIKWN